MFRVATAAALSCRHGLSGKEGARVRHPEHQRIDHRRKYTNQPYDTHLKAVAQLVAGVTDDAEMVAAAWLHDVVEDTPVTLEEVREAFGGGVAALVDELTDVSRPSDGNRAARC